MGLSQFEEHKPYTSANFLDDADPGALVPITGLILEPIRLDSIVVTSDDTVDHLLEFWATYIATGVALLGTVNVPAGAGTDGVTPPVEVTTALFDKVGAYIAYPNNEIAFKAPVAPSSGKHIWVTAVGGTF